MYFVQRPLEQFMILTEGSSIMKDGEMGGTCNTHNDCEKYRQNFNRKKSKEKRDLGRPKLDDHVKRDVK
jgi:hypothetical protein